MKKLFILSLALIAVASVATAQSYTMDINYPDGTFTTYDVDDVENVVHKVYPWSSHGTGTYTFGNIAITGALSDIELEQSTDDNTIYRLHSFLVSDCPLTFTLDKSTNTITVPEQDTEYYGGAVSNGYYYYGYIYVMEAQDFIEKYASLYGGLDPTSDHSYYDRETGEYKFALAYYLLTPTNTYLLFGYTGLDSDNPTYYQYETFTIDNPAPAPAKKIGTRKQRAEEEKSELGGLQLNEPIAIGNMTK